MLCVCVTSFCQNKRHLSLKKRDLNQFTINMQQQSTKAPNVGVSAVTTARSNHRIICIAMAGVFWRNERWWFWRQQLYTQSCLWQMSTGTWSIWTLRVVDCLIEKPTTISKQKLDICSTQLTKIHQNTCWKSMQLNWVHGSLQLEDLNQQRRCLIGLEDYWTLGHCKGSDDLSRRPPKWEIINSENNSF